MAVLRTFGAVVLLCALVASLVASPVPAHNPAGGSEHCSDPVHVPGQGPSCPAPGGWWVRLGDGTWLFTHGPDPVPSPEILALAPPAPAADGAPPGPVCAAGPHDPHMLLVYTVPVDRPDRYLTMAERVRQMARDSNAYLRMEAAEHGKVIDYKVACDVTGALTVAHEILATPSSADGFTTITTELRARGYTSPVVKYWVWHDDFVSGIGGQGNIAYSDSPSSLNANNRGPTYAITYGYDSWFIMMHENGHNMGAVQNTAPETSGAGHCNDGADIMCYPDGGSQSGGYNHHVCTDRYHFDCRHDTYFHGKPPPGNWLWNHWNLGSPLNSFVRIEGACLPRQGLVASSDLDLPTLPTVIQDNLPADCGGRFFMLTSVKAANLLDRDFSICWFSGATQLSCQDTPGLHETGAVPLGAERAEIAYHGNGVVPYLLMMN